VKIWAGQGKARQNVSAANTSHIIAGPPANVSRVDPPEVAANNLQVSR